MTEATNPTNTKVQAAAGQIRPATAQGLVYKAFRRPYGGAGAPPVLELFASGFYVDAPWELFFSAVPGEPWTFVLNERVPGIVYFIVTYYAASYSTGVGRPGLPDKVTIVDAHGRHEVPVQPHG
jgi:hypothetical protein